MRTYSTYPLVYRSSKLSIEAINRKSQAEISLFLSFPYVNTLFFPKTLDILEQNLPTVLKSKCFNKFNLPFRTEAAQTEMGHLFEHILLEYLFKLNLKYKGEKQVFSGRTSWDWKKDPRGLFKITINTTTDMEKFIFTIALGKSIEILEKIITSEIKKEGQRILLPLEYNS